VGVLFALASAMSWGICNVFTRKAQLCGTTDRLSGLYVTLMVNNLLNLLVVSISLMFIPIPVLNARGLLLFAVGGLLNSCVGRGFLFLSISHIGAPKAGVIKGVTPVFVLLGGIFILRESLGTSGIVGILFAITGVLIVSLDMLFKDHSAAKSARTHEASWKGILIGLAAAFFLASGNLCRKAGLGFIASSILGVTTGSLSGIAFLSAFLLFKGKLRSALQAVRHMDKNYFLSGIFAGAALYLLFLSLLTLPVTVSNSFTASEPLFTLAASYLILKKQDPITWRLILGGSFVIAGAVILILP
jgi:drug/metabolite transporter (DMT)-like permease